MSEVVTNSYRFATSGIDDTALKAYYKFDEASGDIINQSESSEDLGSSADQQVTGATYGETGILDDALLYDGTNDYSRAGTSLSQFDFCHVTGHEWTLNFWLWQNTQIRGTGVMGTSWSADTNGFLVGASTNNRMFLRLDDGSAGQPIDDAYSVNSFIGDGTWEMFTITWSDPNEEAIVYRDYDSATWTIDYALPSRTTGNAGNPMTSGMNPSLTGTNWFAGKIDEVSFWDRILTSNEIEALYNSGSAQAIYG